MHRLILLVTLTSVLSAPLFGETECRKVGGVLMTNINAIKGDMNLGPVFGDLQGSVAANIVDQRGSNFILQHYWVTSTGDTILFDRAELTPAPTGDMNVAAVLWGNYKSAIIGGTGLYEGAKGQLEYFGIADFKQLTLVLRYRGFICFEKLKVEQLTPERPPR